MFALLAVWLIAFALFASASEPVSSGLPEAERKVVDGPARLKVNTHLTVETNTPPTASTTNAPRKTFDWSASWNAWDGLHFALDRKTFLGQEATSVTNFRAIHLAETRMAGKLGAKFAVDGAAYVADESLTGFDAGAEVRRARVYARGDCLFLVPVSYELEIGYIPGSFHIENSYLEFPNLGFLDFLGSLKGGQFTAPMSLENYESSGRRMAISTFSKRGWRWISRRGHEILGGMRLRRLAEHLFESVRHSSRAKGSIAGRQQRGVLADASRCRSHLIGMRRGRIGMSCNAGLLGCPLWDTG